jgi:hypothetical protein
MSNEGERAMKKLKLITIATFSTRDSQGVETR